MMLLVIGGCGSGKSSYAENALLSLAKKDRTEMYYLAAMQVTDQESRQKAERHRRNRSGKGFHTLEQPTDIARVLERMGAGENAALLECISNLTANEMFSGDLPKSEEQTEEAVAQGVEALRKGLVHLVVVSNNVFEDGNVYDPATMSYIRAMGRINRRLAAAADQVVEVAAGIPLAVKPPGELVRLR